MLIIVKGDPVAALEAAHALGIDATYHAEGIKGETVLHVPDAQWMDVATWYAASPDHAGLNGDPIPDGTCIYFMHEHHP